MCPVCSITTKLSDVLASLRMQRKRARIYKRMQKSSTPARHVPAVRAGIETYNYRGE